MEGLVEAPFELTLDSPAILAESLKTGELDIAFIPTIEYARIPGLKIVPGFSIAAFGEVKTVLMLSKNRVWNIEKVAADRRSRTSVALLKILFREYYRTEARIVTSRSKKLKTMLKSADAALIIGDEAFKVKNEEFIVTDLSKAWFAFTGKPFVFAIICVRESVDASDAVYSFNEARKKNLELVDDICKKAAEEQGIPVEVCRNYLANCIRYNLDSDDLEGLKTFFSLAEKHGIIEKNPELLFFEN